MTEHTLKAFDDDINALRALIAEMGGLTEDAIDNAIKALTTRDVALAKSVVAGDARIDELDAHIERLVVQTIALRAPMADDLREIIAVLKIAGIVERMADYAKNIAKRVETVTASSRMEPLSLLPSMAQIAREMVKSALDAFAARDAQQALAVIERDRAVDDFYNSIFRTMVTFMMENQKMISESAHVLFIAKNLERIGDHATNIAEMVHYVATGAKPPEREKGTSVDLLAED
ncbi:phosphate transport system protein [Sphingobium sp. B2D3A]|uniref:phosphate signaling complex protein PhoU n=1 Tax=Sphingobium TaxID=165695 RepID=UPI0015ECC307|nr:MULTISPECIES: phosphate signaling complex protein PhoU [Sphingobium]MCW2338645.1 phosphate transport system protein [Sphingobium sp. B2D3A]MCW2349903.1 phosphate transport system protein [Sphingobium sp. B12D2B]MCW2364541.1 phosphate transport system protein [Sphingobium sp. B10D3B]MCW2366953.1 phosphate transport system protein [Sphingobium sp. B7D2B]MCW2369004.1 phosphate transport system protein [Sphingobium sp. B11D3D]